MNPATQVPHGTATMTRGMVLLFAFCCGAIVANIYYAQPIIGLIAPDIGLTNTMASLIVSLTQIGYALGLFFLVPLGDMLENRRLMIITTLVAIASLLGSGRDVPVTTAAFRALFDHGPAAFVDRLSGQGLWGHVDRDRLHRELAACIGLDSFAGSARHAPHAYLQERHAVFRDPCLGTVGSGNHFVELQVVDEVLDRHAAYRAGLRAGDVVVMIHSGSRDLGFYVGQAWMDRARAEWPQGVKHPASGLYGLSGPLAGEYLQAMGVAARYAWANRVVLAELVRKDLEQIVGAADSRLVVDVPHNVVLQQGGMNIHRKGATPANEGDFALIPGSMGDASYLVTGLGAADWLWSCSHGAGRRMRRQAVRALRPEARAGHSGEQGWQCVTLREERRIEEAPEAYKPIGPVIESQEAAGLIHAAVKLRPWITFKA